MPEKEDAVNRRVRSNQPRRGVSARDGRGSRVEDAAALAINKASGKVGMEVASDCVKNLSALAEVGISGSVYRRLIERKRSVVVAERS